MAEPQPTPRPAFNRVPRSLDKAPKLKDVKTTLKRLAGYLKKRWRTIAIVIILASISTLISIIGTRLNGYTVDNYIIKGDISGLAIICILLAVIYITHAGTAYLQNILMVRAAQRTAADIRRDLFTNMQRLPLVYFDTHSSGDLMSRLINDVDNINSALSQNVVQFFTSVIMITGILIAMLILSPLLTLVALVTMPLTFFISRFLVKLAQRFYIAQQSNLGAVNGYIEEMVSGQKIVRLFSREPLVQEKFEDINTWLAVSSWKAQSISGIVGPGNNFVNNLSYLLVSVIGGASIVKGYGTITIGVVFSFLLYMRNFTNPINNLLTLVNTLQLALASAERVFEIIDEPQEEDTPNAVEIGPIKGDIEMDVKSFSYVEGKEVLHNTTITASAGQTVAIVGPTGAGKTTIINLLSRFYDLQAGEILIDGKDICGFTRKSLRRSVAMVLQDTFLFSDTIRENIRYGCPHATDEQVEQAAKQAYAYDFIMQLPDKFDTCLLDNGQNLSQGQRQLIGIARAIITDASILILDEATSSIDTRTELLIQSALLDLMKGKTSFVIAHRLSTIKNADKILFINAGQVVESGTHDELIDLNGFYGALYNSQFKSN